MVAVRRSRAPRVSSRLLGVVVVVITVTSGLALATGHPAPAAVPHDGGLGVGTDAPASGSIPALCARVHPADLIPLRAAERSWNEVCSYLHRPTGVGPEGAGYPQGFGIYNLFLTYDAYDGYVLLLGANGGNGSLNGTQTWTFRGGAWSEVAASVSPESCVGSVLAFDSVDGYVVYLGGGRLGSGDTCSSAGETWTYRSGTWTELHPSPSPSPRQGAAFANDSADGYLLLFGGINASDAVMLNDSWSFAAGSWTLLTPTTAPSARSGAGMAYDAVDGYVLLFGGSAYRSCTDQEQDSVYCMDRDTWSFRAGAWTQLNPTGAVPPEPYDDGLVYDGAAGTIFYTVTDDNWSSEPELYWTFTGGNWTDRGGGYPPPSVAPSNRFGEGLAYDWADGYDVLYGGTGITWGRLTDTWTYAASTWKNITAVSGFSAVLTYAPNATEVGRSVVLTTTVYGGSEPFSYAYSGLPPGCATSNSATLACSPTASGSYVIHVTVTNVTNVSVGTNVTLEVYSALALGSVSAFPNPVALGGLTVLSISASGGVPPLTYAYSGLPAGCATADTSDLGCVPTAAGNYTVTLDAYDALPPTSAVVSGQVELRVEYSSGVAPSITSFSVSPNPVAVGTPVTFVADVTSTEATTESYVGLPPGCASANTTVLACTPTVAGTYSVQVQATATSGAYDTAATSLLVAAGGSGPPPPAALAATLTANPSTVPAGGELVLYAVGSGGVVPYTFAYSGVPAPCTAGTSDLVVCFPTELGSFHVTVVLTDANGTSVSASADVTVTAASVATATPAAAGPTWWDLAAAVVAAGSLAALVAVALVTRRRGPPG